MFSTTESRTAISLTPPPTRRLRLQPDRPAHTLQDGGWWPQSADPAAELPGLILALTKRHGPFNPVNRIMLGMADWNPSRPRRLLINGPAGCQLHDRTRPAASADPHAALLPAVGRRHP